jgi:tagatose-1,6-bisphosphate aldolase
VDVLKGGSAAEHGFRGGFARGWKEILYSREEVMDYYRQATEEARVPLIYLSQEVSNLRGNWPPKLGLIFTECLTDGPPGKRRCNFVEHGLTALEHWLHSEGVRNIENVNQHLRTAQPWFWMKEETHSEKR